LHIFFYQNILTISLYHIIKLNAIKIIKNIKCIIVSIFSEKNFFQNILLKIEFKIINKNLHQSKAGIGKRLKTQRFIEIKAQIISKNKIQLEKVSLIKFTIQIGQLIEFIASCLSVFVSGVKIFFAKSESAEKVKRT
jgi:hypothetical protein